MLILRREVVMPPEVGDHKQRMRKCVSVRSKGRGMAKMAVRMKQLCGMKSRERRGMCDCATQRPRKVALNLPGGKLMNAHRRGDHSARAGIIRGLAGN
ncbi:hypothetical protein O181_058756 [Austropuccinia psidii MF-1]|uniref:Uncharacterized protein n=1 Tax=Austropuccinia psidii MF-1 TaxID=1389203 RepID=A0A9Q3HV51_9BASI|nr:hypothetical protein [Austropuccinia psidii MF-1]